MPEDLISQLEAQKKQLVSEVFAATFVPKSPVEKLSRPPLDPILHKALQQTFHLTANGRLEALRMEVDVLRRAILANGTEIVHRSFGVVQLLTPVKQKGRTVFLLDSGPLKIGPWQSKEKATLAKFCGLPENRLPAGLDAALPYTHAQLKALQTLQEELAEHLAIRIGTQTSVPNGATPQTEATSSRNFPGAQLDLLQPGFADHLGILFSTIHQQMPELTHGIDSLAAERILLATRRGLHLIDQLKKLGDEHQKIRARVSVHELVGNWTEEIAERDPNVRFDLKLKATHHEVVANPHALNHLLYTMLAGVADGLAPQQSLIAVGSRDAELDGAPCLHLEIRDSGGYATFAGVDVALDRALMEEQNDAAEEFADWVGMAERMAAQLRIHRDEGIVTRVEIFIPLQSRQIETNPSGLPLIWIVQENDKEAEQLSRMLNEFGARILRLHSGAELRQQYELAPAPPDMVILEYLLSDTRGAHLRTWLYEQDPDLPVVLMSGFSVTHPGVATASNLPSTLYLQKPFDAQSLFDMLRMTLRDTLPGD
ncbi:MAG: response regulator [Verrucomicrobia bacterium]|nr:response regulator [Verrucomicrobiota bacterium]MCH8511707.1 response regulator [Kiritimatiellia bacterium]